MPTGTITWQSVQAFAYEPAELILWQGGVQASLGCESFEGENPGSGRMTPCWYFVESDLGWFQCAEKTPGCQRAVHPVCCLLGIPQASGPLPSL